MIENEIVIFVVEFYKSPKIYARRENKTTVKLLQEKRFNGIPFVSKPIGKMLLRYDWLRIKAK